MTTDRELTQREQNMLTHLRRWERLVDERKLYAIIYMPGSAIDSLLAAEICHPLRISPSVKYPGKYDVYVTLSDYHRYLEFGCEQVGFTLMLDGSIRTKDNLTIVVADTH